MPAVSKLRSLGGLFSARPLTLDYYRNEPLQAWVRQVTQELPIRRVLVFSSAMAQYVANISDVRRIIDFVDVDSDKWLQYSRRHKWPLSWLYRREGLLLQDYEREVARHFDASLFVSSAEAELFKQLAPESAPRIAYFNNGVDTDYFSPERAYPNPYAEGTLPLVFTGAMDYWPNVDGVQWFAREVLPYLLAHHPETRFYIVGARPSAAVRKLGALPGIVVTGKVPDVRPYLAHARAAVVPLRIARGIQNKVLEAMAMARPVVATAQALEGISAEPGREVMLASDNHEFVASTFALLSGSTETIGAAARNRVLKDYTWEHNLGRVEELLIPIPGHNWSASHAPTSSTKEAVHV